MAITLSNARNFHSPKITDFIFPFYSHFNSLWQPVDNCLLLCLCIVDIEHKYRHTINISLVAGFF